MERLLSKEKFAGRIKRSIRTLDSLIKSGKVIPERVGGRLVIPESQVKAVRKRGGKKK